MEDNAQAAKCTNAEVKLGTDQGWYKNEGSFCGFGLLNNELTTGPATATPTAAQQQQYGGAWGDVTGNALAADARQSQAPNTVVWNPFGGQSSTMPLGLISGVGRMKQYLPLSVFGELNITLFTGSAGEVCFQLPGQTNADFSLNGVYLTYDIVKDCDCVC